MPAEAYRSDDVFDADQGLGCASCAVFMVAMLVIGAIACFVLLKAYALI